MVTTSKKKLAGTNANVCITLFGESSDSGSRLLKESPAGKDCNKDKFECGKTDRFLLTSFDLGILKKIKVEKHDTVGHLSTYIVHIRIIAALISFVMNCSWCFVLYRALCRMIGILLRFR
jgi:PLAT/LH2 domain